jgi:NAD(P)-dependent dehydrogenase (short-subunit alcohol dehydrogenase family)
MTGTAGPGRTGRDHAGPARARPDSAGPDSAEWRGGEPGTGAAIDFTGRRVAVTGAAGAIGAAVARRFAAAGAQVTGLDLRPGPGVTGCDITDEAAVRQVLTQLSRPRPLTDLVHCAGILGVGELLAVPAAQIRRVLEVNLMGAFLVAQVAGGLLTSGATMTFLGSQAGGHGAPGWAAYCATKAGVSRLVEALAQELGPAGVRVNAVCPGTVDSPMTRRAADLIGPARGVTAAEVLRDYARDNPLRRIATADEIAGVCLFLASPLASYINGASIVVDGGDRPG